MNDRRLAVGGVETGVLSVWAPWEVPAAPPVERDEPIVASRHDQDLRARRQLGFHRLPDPGDESRVLGCDRASFAGGQDRPGPGRAREHLRKHLVEGALDDRASVQPQDVPATSAREPPPGQAMLEQTLDPTREGMWVVGDQQLASIPNAEPLGADGGGHGWSAHHQRLDYLPLRPGAVAQRHDRESGGVQIGEHRGHPTHGPDVRERLGQVPRVLLCRRANDRDLVFGEQGRIEAGNDLLAQIGGGVAVGGMEEVAEEEDSPPLAQRHA